MEPPLFFIDTQIIKKEQACQEKRKATHHRNQASKTSVMGGRPFKLEKTGQDFPLVMPEKQGSRLNPSIQIKQGPSLKND